MLNLLKSYFPSYKDKNKPENFYEFIREISVGRKKGILKKIVEKSNDDQREVLRRYERVFGKTS